jgi:hypothetical protein
VLPPNVDSNSVPWSRPLIHLALTALAGAPQAAAAVQSAFRPKQSPEATAEQALHRSGGLHASLHPESRTTVVCQNSVVSVQAGIRQPDQLGGRVLQAEKLVIRISDALRTAVTALEPRACCY